jgi:hypothetical protein
LDGSKRNRAFREGREERALFPQGKCIKAENIFMLCMLVVAITDICLNAPDWGVLMLSNGMRGKWKVV